MEAIKRWVMLKPLGYVIPMANNRTETEPIKTVTDIPITSHQQTNATVVPVREVSQNKTPSFEKQISSPTNRSHTSIKNDPQLNGQQSNLKWNDVKDQASLPCNKSQNIIRNDQLLNGQQSHISFSSSPSSNRSDNSNRNDQKNGQHHHSYINIPASSSSSNKSDNFNRNDQRNGNQSNKNHSLPTITTPNFSSSRGITKMNKPNVVNQTKMVWPVTPDTSKPSSSTVKESMMINKTTVANYGGTSNQVMPTNHKPKSTTVRDTNKRNKVSRVNQSEAFDLLTRHQETELGVTIHTQSNTVLKDTLDLQDVFVVCEKATPAITKLANSNFSPGVLKVLHEMG